MSVTRMRKYLARKVASLFFVLIGVSVLTFALTGLVEGNPAERALRRAGVDPTLQEIAFMEERLGLDRSLPEQYLGWVGDALRLDFGVSHQTDEPVLEELARHLPATAMLSLGAFLLMIMLSLPLGIMAVAFHGRWPDKIIGAATFTLMGVPGFVLGTVLLYFVSVRLGWLPMVGEISFGRLVLPMVTLALPMACRYVRLIKGGVLDVLGEDYIFLMRTQGLRERTVLLGGAFKNACIPLVNLLGISFGTLLGGSVIVEYIFSWPGLGSFLMVSIDSRDYPVVTAYLLLMATAFVLINFLIDLLTFLLDPRISFERGA